MVSKQLRPPELKNLISFNHEVIFQDTITLEKLDLRGNWIEGEGGEAVARMLEENDYVTDVVSILKNPLKFKFFFLLRKPINTYMYMIKCVLVVPCRQQTWTYGCSKFMQNAQYKCRSSQTGYIRQENSRVAMYVTGTLNK